MSINQITNQSQNQETTKALIIESFHGKFASSGFSNEDIIRIAESFWQFPSKDSLNKQYIVTIDQNILGTMLLKRKNDEQPSFKEILSLIPSFNFFKLIKLLSIFSILEHHVAENEVYIDHIVASEEYRGQGVGSSLLEEAKRTIKSSEFLSLYVADTNTQAIHLYQQQGFKIIETKTSLIRKHLISEEKWHYMIFQSTN